MSKVTLLNNGMGMHVHAAGCADIKRNKEYRRVDGKWTIEVSSFKECVEDVYGPEAGSFYAEAGFEDDDPNAWESFSGEFKVFPCVKFASTEVAKGENGGYGFDVGTSV